MSKKAQVEKFLTKEVKPDQTSLLFYNFNDYGIKQTSINNNSLNGNTATGADNNTSSNVRQNNNELQQQQPGTAGNNVA